VKTYEAIVKGENIPEPGVPESFKVLIKELQSLGMDVTILTSDEKEINMENFDEDDDHSADAIVPEVKSTENEKDVVTKE
jgi:DNA-directed RNA polymerase subunit beta